MPALRTAPQMGESFLIRVLLISHVRPPEMTKLDVAERPLPTRSGGTDEFFQYQLRSPKCVSSAFNADNATRMSSAWLCVSVPANAFLRWNRTVFIEISADLLI